MTYLLIGLVVFAFLAWRGRVGRVLKAAQWRAPASILSIGLFAAAAFEGLRGGEASAIILLIGGLILVGAARWPRTRPAPRASSGAMSMAEARATLGVGPEATAAEIRIAHARLIRVAHPDRGGTAGLAAQLNAARDRLLKP